MAMRSFSTQRSTRTRPETTYVKLKIALPDNIQPSVKTALYELLTTTKFNMLPIQVMTYRNVLGMPKIQPREDGRPIKPRPIPIGIIRSFDKDTDEFNVMVFGGMAERVKDIMNPMLEIVYSEVGTELRGISRFNLISLGANNYSYDPNSEDAKDDQQQSERSHRAPRQNFSARDDGNGKFDRSRRDRRNNNRGRKPYSDSEDKPYKKSNDDSMGTLSDVFSVAKDAVEEAAPEAETEKIVCVDQAAPGDDVVVEVGYTQELDTFEPDNATEAEDTPAE